MTGKALNTREAKKFLNSHGWELERKNGDHLIYGKEGFPYKITITSGKSMSQKTWKRECKKAGLVA